jgi:F-type H+-transporting ATPase subunit epsilon
MKLTVTTPLAMVVNAADVTHLRTEDSSGAFGILSGHADFITVLEVSVLTWRDDAGTEHHCAVPGGILTVTGGTHIAVVTGEAVPGDQLAELEATVVERFREAARKETESRTTEEQLQAAALQQIYRYLRPEERFEERSMPRSGS